MKPSIGRIVHYRLSDGDAAKINRRREDAWQRDVESHARTAHEIGNRAEAGQVYPMVITRVWNVDPGTVNGQVLLDGNDTLWVTSTTPVIHDESFDHSISQGHYTWPPHVTLEVPND